MEINYIYALYDPNTFERRYIGKTKDPENRYKRHLYPNQLKAETYKNRWLRQLVKNNQKPIMAVLSEVNSCIEDVNDVERFWIRILRKTNRLTNGTEGGDGGFTGNSMTPEIAKKISLKQKGRKWDADDPRRKILIDKQKGIVPLHATRKAIEVNKKKWKVISPLGEIYFLVGLVDFCKLHGLNVGNMYAIAKGYENRTYHKGWTCKYTN